jgi:hypothetical protein
MLFLEKWNEHATRRTAQRQNQSALAHGYHLFRHAATPGQPMKAK